MKNVVVIYWTGTGNTEIMANAVVVGAKEAGAEVKLMHVGEAKVDDVINADAVAMGCPATGTEELEDAEMLPFVESLEEKVKDKPFALFGSHDWGDGEWMETWKEQMQGFGVNMVSDPVICELEPEDDTVEALKNLGASLAK